jgi:hypothetical protein
VARWRQLLFDVVTRAPQVELLTVGDSSTFGEILNSPGAAQVTIPIWPQADLTKEMLKPPRAIYAVEKDDQLVWAGPVITHEYDISAGTVTLGCEGYWNYVRRRFVVGSSLTYTATEQMQIAKNLVDYMQSWSPGGNIGIDASGFTASGVIRDRVYPGYEHGSIGTLVEQLSAVDRGFDFRLYPRWSAGPNSQMALRLDFYYPAVGRTTGVVLDLAANAVTPSVKLDSTNLATTAIVEGQGTGESQLSSIWNYTTMITANGVRLDVVESHSDVSEAATLTDYAKQALYRGQQPIVIPRVEVSADLLGEIVVGDQVRVIANVGLLQLDAQYRITKWTVEIASERMTLDLAPLNAFQL